MDCTYCTPEWLEESAKIYRATPRFQETLKRLTTSIFFRITAEPEWGIDSDIIFGAIVTKGVLDDLRFFNEKETMEKAEFVMAASPQEWKLILTKQHKFLTDFMLNKVKLESGSKVGVLGIAPYADTFIDVCTQVNLMFQEEMTPEQREHYRAYAAQFRARLGV